MTEKPAQILHPSLYQMQPSNSNLGAMPPSELLNNSKSVAQVFDQQVLIGYKFRGLEKQLPFLEKQIPNRVNVS
jgi:hypothetical protein